MTWHDTTHMTFMTYMTYMTYIHTYVMYIYTYIYICGFIFQIRVSVAVSVYFHVYTYCIHNTNNIIWSCPNIWCIAFVQTNNRLKWRKGRFSFIFVRQPHNICTYMFIPFYQQIWRLRLKNPWISLMSSAWNFEFAPKPSHFFRAWGIWLNNIWAKCDTC